MLNPTTILLIITVIMLFAILITVWRRPGLQTGKDNVGEVVRGEMSVSRQEASEDSKRLRQEVTDMHKSSMDSVIKTINETGRVQTANSTERLTAVENRVKSLTDSVIKTINETGRAQTANSTERLTAVENRVKSLTDSNETRLNKLRETVEAQMNNLLTNNEKKLDQMRQTVDEKLQSTLEKRLGESFKLVSERLEAVQRGLGDMQNLATGVGDLKRMLTNVKARGTWGEYQLGAILEQILTSDQFEQNVQIKENSKEVVEYAIRLPGKDDAEDVWLPIDAKFPQEDYQRLLDAVESADKNAVEESTRSLIRSIKNSAKDIESKYIEPPRTTDFAIMFLPTEGLYSEVLRQAGVVEELQHNYRVTIAGPTTLAAILNSLRMGFRTLAIEKRSSEVWETLSAVKTEFGKFGGMLEKAKKQLETASGTIDEIYGKRTRAINRKLKDVEKLTVEESAKVLYIENIEEE